MVIEKTFYSYEFDDEFNDRDLSMLFNFLNVFPDLLKMLIDRNDSNLIELMDEITDRELDNSTTSEFSYTKLFNEAYSEAFKNYELFLSEVRKRFERNDEDLKLQLELIGMTKQSLGLKMRMLDLHMENVNKKSKGGYFNFISKPLVVAVGKFLKLLNSILGSLSKLPGFNILEAIKEFKEQEEAAIDFVDEVVE